jgi:ABC transport system ATP-binding/permease protein
VHLRSRFVQEDRVAIVTLEDITLRFRGPALLEDVRCVIEAQQRIGLLGRNGAGKTSLLKLIAGRLGARSWLDHFFSWGDRLLSASGCPRAAKRRCVRGGPHRIRWRLFLCTELSSASDSGHSSARPPASAADADQLPAADSWEQEHRVEQVLSQMQLNPHADVAAMSAGMKRRVLLARAIVTSPQLLLLDEPTNHLDIDAICWLEDFLNRYPAAFMFVTHDRRFLRRLANRILEIEAGKIFDWSCDYGTFLARKEAALEAQEKQEKLFDKKLAQEEAWIRQGIKARRTRNEGRVRALKGLRRLRGERREKVGTSNLQIQEGIRSGNIVIRAESVSYSYRTGIAVQPVLSEFSTTILRGDKVGIIGPNGSGKTTLLRILLGELQPDSGRVRLGTNLQIAYFDQLRLQLDEKLTVEEDVADGYQTVQIGGSSRHVLGYLQDFLFTPERARTPIAYLSGGERNRVLLAKLFAKPANVIVLDEPTNDLDAETMEMLEQRLVDYGGTLLLVSHDREFLNNVVTSTLVFEKASSEPTGSAASDFRVSEYVGGYDDWQRQRLEREPAPTGSPARSPRSSPAAEVRSEQSAKAVQRKLSFKESKELEELPGRIEQLEADIARLHEELADPALYKKSGDAIAGKQRQLERLQSQLETSYHRWQELEELQSA